MHDETDAKYEKEIDATFSVIDTDDKNVSLVVKPAFNNGCSMCHFFDKKNDRVRCEDKDFKLGPCAAAIRSDKQGVVFMNVENVPELKKQSQLFGKKDEEKKTIRRMEESSLKSFLAAAMLATAPLASDAAVSKIDDKLLNSIAQVESTGRNGLKKLDTNGLYSYGMFQIQQPYLTDANRILNSSYTVEDVRNNPDISRKVVKAYLSNYANHFKRVHKKNPTMKQIIAMHNGGPNGYKKAAALKYADKVMKKLNSLG